MSKLGFGRFCIIAFVILGYIIFALPHVIKDRFSREPETQYQYLTAGFLAGQLSLSIKPAPELLLQDNPYNPFENVYTRLHDASLYKGKYYLYFGPLPVITFYIPFKLLTGFYPPAALGICIFTTLGFLLNFLLLIKIRDKYFPTISESQLNFAGLLIGFANGSPFLFYMPRFYEIAIASAYCFVSLAMFSLYKIFDGKCKASNVVIFSTCLALAAAGRPHFGLACLCLVPAIAYYLVKYQAKQNLSQLLLALFIPPLGIGLALLMYNYARFDAFFEFGHTYQVSNADYTHTTLINENFFYRYPLQLYYYFIKPYYYHSNSPIPSWMFPFVFGNIRYEFVTGILATTPVTLFILFTSKLFTVFSNNRDPIDIQFKWFLRSIVLMMSSIFIFLLSVEFVAQRYETDFLPYLMILAIINIWFIQKNTTLPAILMRIAKPYFIFVGVISILVGICFGLMGGDFEWNFNMCSRLIVFLYYLIPITLILTLITIQSARVGSTTKHSSLNLNTYQASSIMD
jgi:hypothetical protein